MKFQIDKSPAQALRDLLAVPRLHFGDALQIEALRILRLAEELLEMDWPCPDCDGDGEVEIDDAPGECDKCGRVCEHCRRHANGPAECEECETCKGTGTTEWSRDIVYGMRVSDIVKHLRFWRI